MKFKNTLLAVGTFAVAFFAPGNSYAQNTWNSTTSTVTSNGNVGIGTTSPSCEIHVQRDDGNAELWLESFKSSPSAGVVRLDKARGSEKSPTNVVDGDLLGFMMFRGYNGSFQAGAQISANVDGTVSGSGVMPTKLSFFTKTGNILWERMTIKSDGKIQMGTNSDLSSCTDCNDYRLFVTDGIRTEKVKVDVASTNNWADFVFADDYRLKPLNEVEDFITKNKHLPDVPSAQNVVDHGLDLAEMDAILLQKVEELTLYVIELKKENEQLKAANESIQKQLLNK